MAIAKPYTIIFPSKKPEKSGSVKNPKNSEAEAAAFICTKCSFSTASLLPVLIHTWLIKIATITATNAPGIKGTFFFIKGFSHKSMITIDMMQINVTPTSI